MVVLLRLPSLVEPNRYADEDIYLTIGMALREGRILYRDIHDNKPPLIYLTAAVAQNVPRFRFILLLWNLIHVAIFYQLAKLIMRNNRRVAVAGFLFVMLSTLPLLEGNIANGEIFMIMPVTAAMWLFWKNQLSGSFKSFLEVGGLLAFGFLFKVTAVFEAGAVGIFLLFYQPISKSLVDKRVWGLFQLDWHICGGPEKFTSARHYCKTLVTCLLGRAGPVVVFWSGRVWFLH
ncbi:MAG: hypothetical protein UX92_C0024G0020 [Candidatus Amesbacteria bacterium GW2011_GWA1_47_20]|uniref:Glycosyltransferase RgtA/B/C/D-like domain-containing protein n=1 Tax=Candidatus Amesbacteria bacterium GW2011_GWA1_47_20 TaxID=1618354 RepID=A0A0G1VDI5_9BACT|nr:MAG: hypothetical protein UX92_C0024G0020 [Candidatus Amesbacteria bacterium GW2011_GWA1_47_20]